MEYLFDCNRWGSSFAVPSAVVNDYIKLSDGNFVKILLCILCSSSRKLTSAQLAEMSGLSEDVADDAVVHWCSLGVISVEGKTLNVAEPAYSVVSTPAAKPVSQVEAVRPTTAKPARTVVKYTPKEIRDKAAKDDNLFHLFNDIQQVLKCTINGTEQAELLSLYELYRFDVPTILLTADYCVKRGKSSVMYLSTVLRQWYDDGLTSYKDCEKKIINAEALHTFENNVKKIFGVENKLTKKQKDYIEKWKSMKFSDELLEIAYERCVDNIGKLNFNYINTILCDWSGHDVSTPEQVEKLDSKFKGNKKSRAVKTGAEKETSYDLGNFEKYASDMSYLDDEDI